MTTVSKFPLLQLSNKMIFLTIRLMNVAVVLALSLTTKKCKQLVIDAKTKADFLDVVIDNSVTFIVENSVMEMRLAFSIPDDEPLTPGQKKSLRAPSSVEISTNQLENPIEVLMDPWVSVWDFDFKDWLNHIQSIFHYPDTIDYVQFKETIVPFDIKDIKEVFGKTDGLDVIHTGCYAYNQLILQEFLPVKHFSVDTDVFQDSKLPKNLLIQHFETFVVEYSVDRIKTVNLNDLLLMNGKYIEIYGFEISPKEFNQFLKLWIKGAMPQLEYLSISFPNGRVEENVVMKEINYQKFPSKRILIRSGSKEEYAITDGMDFYGKDGLRAAVQVNHTEFDNYFELFVFHDYFSVTRQVESE